MAKDLADGWIGGRLGEIRRGRKLSPGGLAKRIGVARQTVVNWETDTYSPTMESVIKLARALGVSPRTFVPPDPIALDPPAWQTIARKLRLTYDEAMRLRSVLAEAGIAETATPEQVVLAWMRESQIL